MFGINNNVLIISYMMFRFLTCSILYRLLEIHSLVILEPQVFKTIKISYIFIVHTSSGWNEHLFLNDFLFFYGGHPIRNAPVSEIWRLVKPERNPIPKWKRFQRQLRSSVEHLSSDRQSTGSDQGLSLLSISSIRRRRRPGIHQKLYSSTPSPQEANGHWSIRREWVASS